VLPEHVTVVADLDLHLARFTPPQGVLGLSVLD